MRKWQIYFMIDYTNPKYVNSKVKLVYEKEHIFSRWEKVFVSNIYIQQAAGKIYGIN